ncbi:peroxiredoxin [Demequina sp.]|uniref:peroxiredoxin n=1 Tax=Demequina sp. TaxID=2050685 RepID=UPI003A84B6E1
MPEVGTPAPDFTLTDQHGRRVALSDFRGSAVLLVFVPFAFSDTCTNELIELRDAPDLTKDRALEVIVVSCDSIYTLKAWADTHGYGGQLLSDFWPHGEASIAYGVFSEQKGLATRGTFLIDAQGDLAWSVVNPTGQAREIDDYREAIAELD